MLDWWIGIIINGPMQKSVNDQRRVGELVLGRQQWETNETLYMLIKWPWPLASVRVGFTLMVQSLSLDLNDYIYQFLLTYKFLE